MASGIVPRIDGDAARPSDSRRAAATATAGARVDGHQRAAAGGQQLAEHADRAAQLERAGETVPDRTPRAWPAYFVALIGAAGVAPGIGIGPVAGPRSRRRSCAASQSVGARRRWPPRRPGPAAGRADAGAGTPRGRGARGQARRRGRTAVTRRPGRPRRAARGRRRRSPPGRAGATAGEIRAWPRPSPAAAACDPDRDASAGR